MTPQDLAPETKPRKVDDAHRRADERAQTSPSGLRSTAQGLRDRAGGIKNPGDRAAMLRLAAGYEQRANEVDKQLNIRASR
jgi:hypothetical protein